MNIWDEEISFCSSKRNLSHGPRYWSSAKGVLQDKPIQLYFDFLIWGEKKEDD